MDTDRGVSTEGAIVGGSDRPGAGEANGGKPSQPPLSTAERTEKLELLIAKRLQQGYWVESRGDTEAVLVSLGPHRWFGRVGSRRENTREAVTVAYREHIIGASMPQTGRRALQFRR